MDFYRSQPVKQGLETLFGDCFMCRFPDDQLSVTAPAAILAPDRSWQMRDKGFNLEVFHNFKLDGKERANPRSFLKFWPNRAKYSLPTADGVCPITAGT